MSKLRGVPLYPTPLYSMLSNAVIGLILLRLWFIGGHYSLIIGSYFILSGLCRFVEESYRGEPQTWIIGGLKIYQWMAAASLLAGAIITMYPSVGPQSLSFWMDWKVATAAMLFGVISIFAMGADFPNSSKRFARLAPP